jgi:hypothetical protein
MQLQKKKKIVANSLIGIKFYKGRKYEKGKDKGKQYTFALVNKNKDLMHIFD